MKKSSLIAAAAATAASGFGLKTIKDKISSYFAEPDNKRKLIDFGDNTVQKIVGKISDKISEPFFPFINRYDNKGFMEGSGYFLKEPAKDAKWLFGYAKASVVPKEYSGDCYIGGYLAFPPNKANGIINEQMIRAYALDDSSGRGINVFAVIDCVGISGTDIRDIRLLLKDLIKEKNIVSINISATHCHSGIDTEGLWGDLFKAYKVNKKAIKNGREEDLISGKNKDFMDFLKKTSAETIKKAVNNMAPAKLYYRNIPIDDFVKDKRPPYVIFNYLTAIRFVPDSGAKPLTAVYMAAHATCYGDKQREATRDFPGYMCDAIEKAGMDAMFIQGAEAAIATERGPHTPEGLTKDENIKAYGEALAKYILSFDFSGYKEIAPLINVINQELFLKADNKILEMAVKFRLANNKVAKITMKDGWDLKPKDYENVIVTEVGFVELGTSLKLAMVPGELMPELAVGGTMEAWESYNGEEWTLPPLTEILGKNLAVIGLCNDFIGYIIPDNDFGSVFAPLHYEESCSAGKHTASNIINAFIRLKEQAERIRIDVPQSITE